MNKAKLYAHPECWEFKKEHPDEFQSFGCGPGGAGDKFVPDTMYGLNVSNACRIHDWYYRFYPENTEEARKMADRILLNNLLRIVEANTKSKILLCLRRRRCKTYYRMVRTFGASSYFDDRNDDEFMQEI